MSSRGEVTLQERSRSRSVQHYKDRKAMSRDKSSSPSSSKTHHTSKSSKSKDRSSNHKKKKSKKKQKHSSSSSSSSSTDSDEEELKLLQRLEAERLRLKEEKSKQKEMLKAKETPEEKRARRLREKLEKERKRRERMGWDNEYQCYTNQDNPFGDSALTNTFVWTKKLAKEGVKSVSRDELEALNRQKQLENKIELEKVKQRRQQREAERAARESDAAAAARSREAHQLHSWARQEDAFHLRQARLRSQIRIRDGRAKPIDLLACYVSSEHCDDALDMHEPYTYLNGLHMQDFEDLLEDIKVYKELEKNANQSYWEDVETIVCDELNKLRRLNAPTLTRDGVHHAVAADVTQIFKGKTGEQLEALQIQIEQKISGRRDGVDIGYWESLLSQLKAHMARARLRDRHQMNLRRKLQLLKQEQGVASAQHCNEQQSRTSDTEAEGSQRTTKDEQTVPGEDTVYDDADVEDEAESVCISLYKAGRYSPEPLTQSALEPGTILTESDDDAQRLLYLRSRLHAANASREHTLHHPPSLDPPAGLSAAGDGGGVASSSDAALERAAVRAMGTSQDEAQFSVEHALPDQPCLWADKYRPRKPRYFNRVHTGFEWNKYNQTHYDMDNPPPKIVQGYKFNIFYPDLIDNNATPEFTLKPCPDNEEFAVLRFHAGPPYEDIAFKIVNREWEYSYKRGFRCHFHNNIFQLWFHFKRYRYRR